MKISGLSCETKKIFLVFLGHPVEWWNTRIFMCLKHLSIPDFDFTSCIMYIIEGLLTFSNLSPLLESEKRAMPKLQPLQHNTTNLGLNYHRIPTFVS